MPIQPPVPPQDIDAEQAVLGACLLDPDALPKASAIITAQDFYSLRHAAMFEAMVAIAQSGAHPDYVTLSARLEVDKSRADASDEILYMGSLVTATPTAHMVEHYARIVADKAARRKAIALAGDIAKAAYSAEDFEGRRGEWLTALVNDAQVRGAAEHISGLVTELTAEVEARASNPTDIFGIPTGFSGIDRAMGGLQPGEVFLFCGEPGLGKTMFVCQMIVNAAQRGNAGALYEMDTRWQTVVRRQVSRLSRVSTYAMRSGKMDGQMEAYYEAAGKLASLPLYFSRDTNWTTTTLRADLTRLIARHGVTVAMIDYFDLLRDKAQQDRNEWQTMVANELKRLARDLNVALVVIHTMNKAGMRDLSPSLASASGSKEVLYAFENVAFLTAFKPHTPQEEGYLEETRRGLATVTYAKMRESEDGEGYFHLVRGKGFPEFLPYSQEQEGY